MKTTRLAHPVHPKIGGIGVQTILAATLGLALAFTLSCSDNINIGDGGGGGSGEGRTLTYGLENITGSSFTMVETEYICQEDGTLEERTSEYEESYSINGGTLSFGGAEFSGNQSSLTGTWNSSSLQRVRFEGRNRGYTIRGVSKVVFTRNSIALTLCGGKAGEEEEYEEHGVVIKRKIIDCRTYEETVGTQTVRVESSETERSDTYNGKTCKEPRVDSFSKAQMEKECKDIIAKGYKTHYGSNIVEDYYEYNFVECVKSNNFPEWYL